MKRFHPGIFLFLLIARISMAAPAYALRQTDTAPLAPDTAKRFIFYWGKYQCELTQANSYQGNIELTVQDFRQLLSGSPKVWNGKVLIPSLTFKLEEFEISSDSYFQQLAKLDAGLSPKLKPGKTIHLHHLLLATGISGAINFLLDAGEVPTDPVTYPTSTGAYLNEQMVQQVSWGREDILATSDRDFLTVSELWQTLRQEPAVTWRGNTGKPLRVITTFLSPSQTHYTLVSDLREKPYREFLASLKLFSYMVQPGATITLSLSTTDQYDLIYKKTIHIVGDNDPRLLLRRSRDLHQVYFRWGYLQTDLGNLYLHNLFSADGSVVKTDQPIAVQARAVSGDSLFGKFTAPVFEIDEKACNQPFNFRVSVGDTLKTTVTNIGYSREKMRPFFENMPRDARILIDSIAIEGFDLPPITIMVRPILPRTLVKNDFTILNKLAKKGAFIQPKEPKIIKDSLVFEFNMPVKTNISFSIFDSKGRNHYLNTSVFDAGKQYIKVPLQMLDASENYIAFLNTPFGISRVEFVLP